MTAEINKPRPTKAQRRVLEKASAKPLMIWGAFSGKPGKLDLELRDFDRRMVVEICIARGWMCPGEKFNQYEITHKGRAILDRTPTRETAA